MNDWEGLRLRRRLAAIACKSKISILDLIEKIGKMNAHMETKNVTDIFTILSIRHQNIQKTLVHGTPFLYYNLC